MIALSALVHAAIVMLALLVPKDWFLRNAPPLVSYTVDLVAPEQLGGTNLIEGGRGRTQGQTMAAAEPPAPPPQPREEARGPEPPVKAAAEASEKEPPEKAVALAPATPTKVRPTETPTQVAVAAAKVPPTATPLPPAVIEQLRRAAEQEQARRQAEEAERRRREEEAKRRAATAEMEKKVQAQATATAAAEAKQREQIEQRIVAAAKRLQEQAGERGAGSGPQKVASAGGPLSVGPGQGTGGKVMGIDYVLYLGQLERKLKENWAWAGTNDALEAVVGFSILPDGKVTNVRIVKSSGDRSFDLSVERTVRALDPMPPPPEAYRDLFGDVQYTFNAKSMQD
ncbi:MAG: cell envelope integrity protein TolA [Candidatus Binatia bacterium]|nr:cell envelope integrity protein TolA [Candidatus Binatia bacterium]